MVTIPGGLAEFERHLILSGTNDGRRRAMLSGTTLNFAQKLGHLPKSITRLLAEATFILANAN
jgi:hypothetical protein